MPSCTGHNGGARATTTRRPTLREPP